MTLKDFKQHYDILTGLLEESYMISFDITIKKAEKIVKKKMKQLELLLKNNQAVLIGAYKINVLIGFAWIFEKTNMTERRIHVNHIVVSKKHRGKNIGDKLMKEIEIYAKSKDVNIIELIVSNSNKKALKLYENNNYTVERTQFIKKIGEVDV